MQQCPHCGQENWDQNRICQRCRKPLAGVDPSGMQQSQALDRNEVVARTFVTAQIPDPPFPTKLRILLNWSLAAFPFFVVFVFVATLICYFTVQTIFASQLESALESHRQSHPVLPKLDWPGTKLP